MSRLEELKSKSLEDVLWETEGMQEVKESIIETSRWHVLKSTILKDIDGNFYEVVWRDAATEQQERDEYFDVHLVVPVEKTITVYVKKEESK